jgi:serine/threonine-protein kinase RsbT
MPSYGGAVPIQRIAVAGENDGLVAGSVARRFADAHGFDRRASAEVAIAVSELATNIIKHGGGRGDVELQSEGDVLIVRVLDRGPGPSDRLHEAMAAEEPPPGDGRRGTSAVRRLMDSVSFNRRSGGGLEVLARKIRRPW